MKRFISILIITLLLLTGCSQAEETGLPSFSGYDLEGVTRTETIFEDHQLTMVNLWATYCGPCIQEMPALGALHREYADQGFQIVGIIGDVPDHRSNEADTARTLLENADADYVNLIPNQTMEKFLRPFAYVPTTVFLNSKGEQVSEPYIGARSKEDWAKIIDQLLEEQGA